MEAYYYVLNQYKTVIALFGLDILYNYIRNIIKILTINFY